MIVWPMGFSSVLSAGEVAQFSVFTQALKKQLQVTLINTRRSFRIGESNETVLLVLLRFMVHANGPNKRFVRSTADAFTAGDLKVPVGMALLDIEHDSALAGLISTLRIPGIARVDTGH